jgi:hypothetical protein
LTNQHFLKMKRKTNDENNEFNEKKKLKKDPKGNLFK